MTALEARLLAPEADARGSGTGARLLRVAAATTALAGVGHVAAALGHREAGVLVGGFFGVAALAQLSAAAWLLRRARARTAPQPVALGGALIGTVALVVLYLLVHASDLVPAELLGHGADAPGVAAGHPAAESGSPEPGEAPGVLGAATVAAELVTAVVLLPLLPAPWRERAGDAVLVLGGLAWLLWALGILR